MSYCSLVFFKDGKADSQIEYKNSHGGAMMVWSVLFNKYVKDPSIPYDNVLSRTKDFWPIVKREDLPLDERAVCLFTYDDAYVAAKNYSRLVVDLRSFESRYVKPTAGGQSGEWAWSHLLAWADDIEKHGEGSTAIALHATSVCENPWFGWDDKTDESVPYDMATGDKHWEIYESLAEMPMKKANPSTKQEKS